MRICADENIPEVCVRALRAAGHDVSWIRETSPGAPDSDVLAFARNEDRVLITFDKDFGDLIYLHRAERPPGIILFRIPLPSPAAVSDRLLSAIASRDDWIGNFSVVDEQTIRMRKLDRP